MGVLGDMNQFQQYQMGKAMVEAAGNPSGGGAAEGMGLGMGFAMAGRMMQGAGAAGPGMAPPPLAPPMWHIAVDGQSQGPFTVQQLAQAIAGGRVTTSTPVWCAGMESWTPAGQVPQLGPAFVPHAAPPPPVSDNRGIAGCRPLAGSDHRQVWGKAPENLLVTVSWFLSAGGPDTDVQSSSAAADRHGDSRTAPMPGGSGGGDGRGRIFPCECSADLEFSSTRSSSAHCGHEKVIEPFADAEIKEQDFHDTLRWMTARRTPEETDQNEAP
jgi:hypothetical protein